MNYKEYKQGIIVLENDLPVGSYDFDKKQVRDPDGNVIETIELKTRIAIINHLHKVFGKTDKTESQMVNCHKVYAIYASYDAFAPTTADLILCATAKLAQEVIDRFNTNPREVRIAYTEGFEGWKRYDYRTIYVPNLDNVKTTYEEAMKEIES